MEEPFISLDHARSELGNIGRTKLYELVARGDLDLVKLGRKSLISGLSMRRFKEKLLKQIAPEG